MKLKLVTLAALVMVLLPVSLSAQSGTAVTIPQAQLMQPEELNQLLASPAANKPLVLQVGSHVMFTESHIKGSEYVGPGSQDLGIKALQDRVQKLPRTSAIVIYCGCCPWGRCPNIAPAFKALTAMGFTHVKALYLANNFGADWQSKGYAVASGD